MPHIRTLQYTKIICDHCGITLPYDWPVVLIEPIIPRFIDGQVDLTQVWVDVHGSPCIPPAVFASCEPEEVLEGMEELDDDEYEWLFNSSNGQPADLPSEDCWREIADALGNLVPDQLPSDHPLTCDFCHNDLAFQEPTMRVRNCMIDKPERTPTSGFMPKGNDAKMSVLENFSDYVLCLSCAYTISKEIILPRNKNGVRIDRPLWPML